ncbi:MAG TPA: hypothetical protein VHE10_03130 [Candidatus Paceibacterota bacterium]|nr:hypothetical protein [Candidatus Paceibacterota bacterium]
MIHGYKIVSSCLAFVHFDRDIHPDISWFKGQAADMPEKAFPAPFREIMEVFGILSIMVVQNSVCIERFNEEDAWMPAIKRVAYVVKKYHDGSLVQPEPMSEAELRDMHPSLAFDSER